MTAMESLLDSSTAFDEGRVKLLDTAIQTLYSSNSKSSANAFQEAQSVLTRLQQHPESWRLVQVILQHSELENTRLFALSLLTTAVRTRWKILPLQERTQIPRYLYDLSATVVKSGGSRTLLTKINETLAEVIKRVWPESWTSFIEDLISSASTDSALIFNNLSILALFVEDVLDFGDEEIISKRAQFLKQNLLQKFPVILNYTLTVIKMGGELELKVKALQCSYHCLKHTPISYALDLDIPNILLGTSFQQYETRALCIQCLTEIFSQGRNLPQNIGNNPEPQQSPQDPLTVPQLQKLVTCWHELMTQCKGLSDQSLKLAVPGNHKQFWESFYLNLALCVTAFHKYFYPWLIESEQNTPEQQQLIFDSVDIMRKIFMVPNEECMTLCVDFWQMFSTRFDQMISGFMYDGIFMNNGTGNKELFLYRIYQSTLHDVRRTVITNMARPPEVYVTYDEETGCAIGCKYQQRDDTEELSQYAALKDTLVHLTRIEPNDTESICLEILKTYNDSLQKSRGITALNDAQWNVHLLCKLCWSIGSISGILPKELSFLLTVLKSLLNFCQVKSGKESKALIASMIMYVMGQYPKYLKQNEQLLKVVVDKCLEFMDETFPGVQDMACETFYKVAQGCADKLAVVTTDNPTHTLAIGGGTVPYIVYICNLLPTKASKFTNTKLTLLIYSATSVCIAAHPSQEQRLALLRLMMKPLNDTWLQLLPQVHAVQDPNTLSLDIARTLNQIIGINNCAAEAMANTFAVEQFGQIVTEMLSIYEEFGVHIGRQLSVNRLNFAITKEMRGYKKSVLRLLTTVIENSDYKDTAVRELIETKIIPYVMDRVFTLYAGQNEQVRDHEVMMLGSAIINKWSSATAGPAFDQIVSLLLHQVFAPSLEMIRQNYTSYPEIRKEFFLFVKTLIQKAFAQIVPHIQSFVLSLVFGIQHQNPEFGILALKGMLVFLNQIENAQKIPNTTDSLLQSFMRSCYFDLLSEVFNVLTDTSHQYGFQQQAAIIHKLMAFGRDSPQVAQWLNEFLCKAFPHLGKAQAESYTVRFINSPNEGETRRVAKDLQISLKEYSLDEKEQNA